MKTFETWLQDLHAKYYNGLDDDMPEHFDEWLADKDYNDWIRYAEDWHKSQIQKPTGLDKMSDLAFEDMIGNE